MKIICLDYDGSYTDFPELFDMIIDKASSSGIKVIMATMRYDYEKDEVLQKLENRIPVYYTGRQAKDIFLRNIGIKPNIWIDDNPWFILNDSK